jgi:hypothetical protein
MMDESRERSREWTLIKSRFVHPADDLEIAIWAIVIIMAILGVSFTAGYAFFAWMGATP